MKDFIPKAQVIENFLTDDDIWDIESRFRHFSDIDIQVEHMGVPMHDEQGKKLIECRSHYWYPGEGIRDWLNDFCDNEVQTKYGDAVTSKNWHILNAFKPYGIHSDSYDEDNAEHTSTREGYDYAWTFLVPLADYDAHTFVFNETSTFTKNPNKWIEKTNAPVLDSIDYETYKKYFSHEDWEVVKHFSIDTKFTWKKGSLLAMARHAFHCSCNFVADGLFEKRALIGWSETNDMENTVAHS